MCAMLSKYWPSGHFAVTLNGLLVSPNCKGQKIHFPEYLAIAIASLAFCSAAAK